MKTGFYTIFLAEICIQAGGEHSLFGTVLSRNDLTFQVLWGLHCLPVQHKANQVPGDACRGELSVHGVFALRLVGGGGCDQACS